MKIGSQTFAIGQTVPAALVKAHFPEFYAAAEAQRTNPHTTETMRLTDPFTMGQVFGSFDDVETTVAGRQKAFNDYEARVKAISKRREVLVYGDQYIANKAMRGQFFVARVNGLARARHPEADPAIRIQDATYSYAIDGSTMFTDAA